MATVDPNKAPAAMSPAKVFIQKIDGTEAPIEGVLWPQKPEKDQRWFAGANTGPGFGETVNISFEVSTTPGVRAALKRMAEQASLDDIVAFIRAARARGFYKHYFTMPEELYRFSSAICHRLHNMNLTRYLRSRIRYTARGIHVFLKSGYPVWKK